MLRAVLLLAGFCNVVTANECTDSCREECEERYGALRGNMVESLVRALIADCESNCEKMCAIRGDGPGEQRDDADLFLTCHDTRYGCCTNGVTGDTSDVAKNDSAGSNCPCTADCDKWTEDMIQGSTVLGDATACYYAIFSGAACDEEGNAGEGGVYRISEHWYASHSGGPFSNKNCGAVIQNWMSKSAGHRGYQPYLAKKQNLHDKALYIGEYKCAVSKDVDVETVGGVFDGVTENAASLDPAAAMMACFGGCSSGQTSGSDMPCVARCVQEVQEAQEAFLQQQQQQQQQQPQQIPGLQVAPANAAAAAAVAAALAARDGIVSPINDDRSVGDCAVPRFNCDCESCCETEFWCIDKCEEGDYTAAAIATCQSNCVLAGVLCLQEKASVADLNLGTGTSISDMWGMSSDGTRGPGLWWSENSNLVWVVVACSIGLCCCIGMMGLASKMKPLLRCSALRTSTCSSRERMLMECTSPTTLVWDLARGRSSLPHHPSATPGYRLFIADMTRA